MTMVERVREVLKKADTPLSTQDLYRLLAAETRKEKCAIRSALRSMKRRCEAISVPYYGYIYNRSYRPTLKAVERVWRAWRMCPQWTVDEIARIAEVNQRYVANLVRVYREYILECGKKGYKKIYRLKERHILRKRPPVKATESKT